MIFSCSNGCWWFTAFVDRQAYVMAQSFIQCCCGIFCQMLSVCSESTLFHISACDNSLHITVARDAADSCLVHFQLSGISFLPISLQNLQSSSDHSVHLRLGLREVMREDLSAKFISANDCEASIEALQSAPFYYRCRRCGCVVLDQHLWVFLQITCCIDFSIQQSVLIYCTLVLWRFQFLVNERFSIRFL